MPNDGENQLREREIQIEERRVKIEEQRERRLKAERKRELDLAEAQAEPKHWTEALGNPLVVTAMAGLLALAGNGLVAFVNNLGELNLAVQKEQSDLVLSALGSDDVEKVKENLRLLAEAELITSSERRNSILAYLDTLKDGQGPGGLGQSAPRALLSEINQMTTARRNLTYLRALESGRRPIAIVGDGWLNYPLVLTDIGDYLTETFAVFNQAEAGNCLQDMHNRREAIPEDTELVIVSAGLCELFGANGIISHIRPASESGTAGSFDALNLISLEVNLAILVDRLMAEAPNARVALHGYDYLPQIDPNSPLGSALASRGYESAAADEFSAEIIDVFNDIVERLARERPRLTYVDLRSTIASNEWYDQLYPTSAGFEKLTNEIMAHLFGKERVGDE